MRPLFRRLLFRFLSTTLATPQTYHQSQPSWPSILLTLTSLVLTSFQSQILVEIRKEFQAVKVLRRFLYIIDILIAFLLNQVLSLTSYFPYFQYSFYLIFAIIVFQLDFFLYSGQRRSLYQFQQGNIEYRVQSRFLQ